MLFSQEAINRGLNIPSSFFFFEIIIAVMLERRMESNYLKMGVKMGILNHNKREHAATSCSYFLLTWKR